MAEYKVTWEIDVEADDPVMAAREAQKTQRDRESIAGVFQVMDKNARTERVDLDELDGNHVAATGDNDDVYTIENMPDCLDPDCEGDCDRESPHRVDPDDDE